MPVSEGDRDLGPGTPQPGAGTGAVDAEFSLLVADPWQGQGVGSPALARLIDIARREGIARVYLNILQENLHAALVRGAGITLTATAGSSGKDNDEEPRHHRHVDRRGRAMALALILRPSEVSPPGPELAVPEASRRGAAVIRAKMRRTPSSCRPDVQRRGAGLRWRRQAAGEIFDEPALARPVSGDELNGCYQSGSSCCGALRTASRVVDAAARRRLAGSLPGD
jgi:hypothetical protein